MLAAEGFELVFRTLHIMAGVAWGGSAFLFTVFIEPAAAKLGPAAGPFMEETIGRRKVPEIVLDRSLPARGRRLLHGDRALLVNEPRRC